MPATRSGGAVPPSRVYNSTPTLQQAQFPSRRKKVRRYEKPEPEQASLKQQTLTQFDFVSSFDDDDDIVALSSDDDIIKHGDDKENAPPAADREYPPDASQTQEEDDEIPVSRIRKRPAKSSDMKLNKRRRTLGDEGNRVTRVGRQDDKSRRRTLGDAPTSTNYHTQTLTQFLGHQTSFIADSDDDLAMDENEDGEDGFLSWLGGEHEPGSPSAGRGRREALSSSLKQRHGISPELGASATNVSRENSVIPQTPTKRSTTIYFEMPSGGLQSPSERMMDRYGPPDKQDSPLKNRSSPMRPPPQELKGEPKPEPLMVIQDSYATEVGWSTPSKSQIQNYGTPSKMDSCKDSTSPSKMKASPIKYAKTPSLKEKKVVTEGLYEIPDSDEDDEDVEVDEPDKEGAYRLDEEGYGAGAETQVVMSEIASTAEQHEELSQLPPSIPVSTDQRHPPNTQSESTSGNPRIKLLSTAKNQPSSLTRSPRGTPARPLRPSHTEPPIRKPLHHPSNHTTQPSQPWESQRVPVSVLHSLPSPTARSDIILPISSTSLEALITGHTIHISTPFKIPIQVVRFWLLDNHLLRYMASIEPDEPTSTPLCSSSQKEWRFCTSQVYELNNPVLWEDMREEGWVGDQIGKYSYLPPAVIGQLLWNLRHAVFEDASKEVEHAPPGPHSSSPVSHQHFEPKHLDGELPSGATPPGSLTVSQQLNNQIHSDIAYSTQLPTSDDIIPSTPDDNQLLNPRPSTTNCPPPPPASTTKRPPSSSKKTIHSSQATTLSQASTPERRSQLVPAGSSTIPHPPAPLFNVSEESSIQFLDHSGSLSSLPFPSSLSSTSQLLTKSQMLPDSLIRDHVPPPEQLEIWDSEDNVPL
ncbi:hypothetical protein QQS21_007591 [Conoideocrella luteorostrata]|uniref:Uncharacterized protein n=1 Tax=Conoideocrella luteorostrata TaxID=1105319 RepID=A0AAJ0CN84_9HYPO|nr:hypothetical protein QQS21_007591 [Conoideocrella luteorostrata]